MASVMTVRIPTDLKDRIERIATEHCILRPN